MLTKDEDFFAQLPDIEQPQYGYMPEKVAEAAAEDTATSFADIDCYEALIELSGIPEKYFKVPNHSVSVNIRQLTKTEK